jgi:hypothetical protein
LPVESQIDVRLKGVSIMSNQFFDTAKFNWSVMNRKNIFILYKLVHLIHSGGNANKLPDKQAEMMDYFVADPSNFWLLTYDNEPIGYCRISINDYMAKADEDKDKYDDNTKSGKFLFIHSTDILDIVLDPERIVWGSVIGSLIHHMEVMAKQKNLTEIIVNDEGSQGYRYVLEDLGFKRVPSEHHYLATNQMRKRITS